MTNETHSALSNFFEDLCARVFGNVVRNFKVTKSSGALCVYDAFWDSLTIEVSHFINKVDILKQEWSTLTDSLRGCLDANWSAMSDGCNCWTALKSQAIKSIMQFSMALISGILNFKRWQLKERFA
jgi:hypothetical protein